MTYETGDPSAYVLPDVVCDLSNVHVQEIGSDRVRVSGASGREPTSHYKVSVTYGDGYRCLATLLVRGIKAPQKARAIAHAVLQRCAAAISRHGFSPLRESSVEILGAEEAYGRHARAGAKATREVVLKLAVSHAQAKALEIFSREIFPTSTSTVQGVAGVFGGRPKVQPAVRLFSFLLDKQKVSAAVHVGSMMAQDVNFTPMATRSSSSVLNALPKRLEEDAVHYDFSDSQTADLVEVPLVALACARSGDKGDFSNIAVLARQPQFLALIRQQLSAERVRDYFSHLVRGPVERFEWPGLNGFNFLLHEALGGGGTASLRYDPQGKAHAQILLDIPMQVPVEWKKKGWLHVDN